MFSHKGVDVWRDDVLHAYLTVDSPVWIGMNKALSRIEPSDAFWENYKHKVDRAIQEAVRAYYAG